MESFDGSSASSSLASATIITGVFSDIQTLTDFLNENVKDPSNIDEADLETAAIATGVDLRAVVAQLEDGFAIMRERGENPTGLGIRLARSVSPDLSKKGPCLEQYEQDMIAAVVRTAGCVITFQSSPYAQVGCGAGFIILASIADNAFDECLDRTYPNASSNP